MSYFAEIGPGNVVQRVIVADASYIVRLRGTWVETFLDGSQRKNYAGPGYTLDTRLNAFVPPRPTPDYVLDDMTARYKPNLTLQGLLDAGWAQSGGRRR